MGNFIKKLIGFALRLVLAVASLVFALILMAIGFLLLLSWLLRAVVARLMGRSVSPWTFKVNRQAVWGRFNAAQNQGKSDQHDHPDIIDAEVKEIKEIKEIKQLDR